LKENSDKILPYSVFTIISAVTIASLFILVNAFGAGPDLETGEGPRGLGINAFTNKIYVANYLSDTVSVIDGQTNSIETTIPLEGGLFVTSGPAGIAVNSYRHNWEGETHILRDTKYRETLKIDTKH